MTASASMRICCNPIRDLASNWDVNIADELEDYLVDAATSYTAAPLASSEQCATAEHVAAGGAGGRQVLFRGWAILEFCGRYLPAPRTATSECMPCDLRQSDWVTAGLAQPRWSSRAPRSCTARRWSTCTSWSTRLWSASRRKGAHVATETRQRHNSPAPWPASPAQCHSL